MTLLEFARGPGLQWSVTIFIVGVLWRLLGVFLLRGRKDLSEPRNRAAWKGLRLIALRSWPRREFLGGTAFGEVMGYAFHLGFLLTLFFYVPHVLFFADVSRGLIGTDLQGLTGFAWPTLPNGIVTLLAVHLLSVELLLVWFPFGKLMHAFTIFAARGATGLIFERRGASL
jgi:hypothetical protein